MGLDNYFANSFWKASKRTVWVCLCFIVGLYTSKLLFSSNFVISLLNSDPLSRWNTFQYLNTWPLLYSASNTNATSLAFFLLTALNTLYIDATSTFVSFYLHVLPPKTLWATKSRPNGCWALTFSTSEWGLFISLGCFI